jgi:hypothetical protein
LQEQGRRSDIADQILGLETQFGGQETAINARIEAARLQAERQDAIRQEDIDRATRFREEDIIRQREDADFQRALALLDRKRITPAQFEQMTGLTVSEARASGRRSTVPTEENPPDDKAFLLSLASQGSIRPSGDIVSTPRPASTPRPTSTPRRPSVSSSDLRRDATLSRFNL